MNKYFVKAWRNDRGGVSAASHDYDSNKEVEHVAAGWQVVEAKDPESARIKMLDIEVASRRLKVI